MRYAKGLLLLLCMVVLLRFANRVASDQVILLILLVPAGVLLISIALRNKTWMKNFLLHPANILTSKRKHTLDVDIPADLLFEKMQEVIKNSKYKLRNVDMPTHTLLATASMSVWSWGENIYVTVEPHGAQSQIKVSSVAFQAYDWGRNEDNFSNIINDLERSLIV